MAKLKRVSQEGIQILRSDENDSVVVEGYAALYGVPSKMLVEAGRGIIEVIEQGAFDKAVENVNNQSIDCVATFQHDRDTLLARTKSGTLQLKSDEKGLWFRFEVPNTTVGRDIVEQLKRGDLNQCSFVAFAPMGNVKLERREDGLFDQTVSEFTILRDIALVIDPAYEETYVDEVKRSIEAFEDEELKTKRSAEEAEELAKKEVADKEDRDRRVKETKQILFS